MAHQINQVHQGLERHTYFEVSAGIPLASAPYDLSMRNALFLIQPIPEPDFQGVRAHQPDNWPVLFGAIYRHIPSAKSGDPDPVA